MQYTVTITSAVSSLTHTCGHIVDALDLVQRVSGDRCNPFDLFTYVIQHGEWIEWIDGAWYRVVAARLS